MYVTDSRIYRYWEFVANNRFGGSRDGRITRINCTYICILYAYYIVILAVRTQLYICIMKSETDQKTSKR